ncbi:MAG: hypothetical protein ACUVTD_01395 [Nitrososphaerales archaeon]
MGYAIIRCGWCTHFLVTKTKWKSRTCPYCHNRLNPSMTKAYGYADDEEGARIKLMEVAGKHSNHSLKALFKRASELRKLTAVPPELWMVDEHE